MIVEEGKVRVAHDWSNELYPLSSVLDNPPDQFGTTDDFLQLLTSGAYTEGVDLRGCFLH